MTLVGFKHFTEQFIEQWFIVIVKFIVFGIFLVSFYNLYKGQEAVYFKELDT